MTTITIPCDTIVRLSSLLPGPGHDVEPIFHTMRLDNGKAIVTDRRFCAVEELKPFEGAFHIKLSDALIQQCKVEQQFAGSLTVSPNAMLKWTVAFTTLGYNVTENIGVYPTAPTLYDEWYDLVVAPALKPNEQSNGAWSMAADEIARLAASSPSGEIVFEANIDVRRSTAMRDVNDPRWCGFFMPRLAGGMYYPPATVPGWLRR